MIYTYGAGKRVKFDTRVEDNKATTKVTHFSTFVLFDEGEGFLLFPQHFFFFSKRNYLSKWRIRDNYNEKGEHRDKGVN